MFTLVEHSAASSHPEFAGGLETVGVTVGQASRVLLAAPGMRVGTAPGYEALMRG